MSDMSKPGKRMICKISHNKGIVKAIIAYNPAETDLLNWNEQEKKVFQAAAVSKLLSDKLFAFFVLAKKLEGDELQLQDKIIKVH